MLGNLRFIAQVVAQCVKQLLGNVVGRYSSALGVILQQILVVKYLFAAQLEISAKIVKCQIHAFQAVYGVGVNGNAQIIVIYDVVDDIGVKTPLSFL